MTDEQAAPPQDPTPPSEPAAPAGDQAVSSEERTMGMLCHLLAIFTWFIGPLVIWLIKKDEMSFVDDQGKEAVNFSITVTLAYIASFILVIITLGILFFVPMLVGVGALVFMIIATVKANSGERYRYPVCLRLIK